MAAYHFLAASCLLVLLAGSASACDLPYCKVIAGQEVVCKNPNSWFEYHPHPIDPTKFIQCTTYGPQVMSCPTGTVWNQAAYRCDFQNNLPSNLNPKFKATTKAPAA